MLKQDKNLNVFDYCTHYKSLEKWVTTKLETVIKNHYLQTKHIET